MGKLARALCFLATLSPIAAQAEGGGVMGEPTPALAIYAAQVRHAHAACAALGGAADAKASDTFYDNAVERGLQLKYYVKHVPEFAPAMDAFGQHYAQAWATMAPAERDAFCSGYLDDVAWASSKWRLPVVQAGDRFRSYFSPQSAERIAHAKTANFLLGVLSLGATAAGVNQTRQHDFAAAGDLNRAGATLANGMADPAAAPGGCSAYAPFVAMNRAVTAGDFRAYHSVRECR